MVTLTPPAVEAAIVIVAAAVFVPSATDVAVRVTVAGLGIVPGAVKVIGVPDALVAADKLPHVAPLHPGPESAQLTPWFEESPVTVAVKVVVAFTGTVAVVCASDTEIPPGAAPIVIVAEADFVPSLTDVAVSVAVAGFGVVAGAVYVTDVPEALVVADSEPQPFAVAQESDQVTPLLALSFETVGVKVCVLPRATIALVGATLTAIGVELPPPLGEELPPQPATNAPTNARTNAAAAHIARRRRCFCARTITLLQCWLVLVFSSRLLGIRRPRPCMCCTSSPPTPCDSSGVRRCSQFLGFTLR
jgi:hypothetical protein